MCQGKLIRQCAARGKWEVISEPKYLTIACKGQQSYPANFYAKGIMEG